jgi:hypothetical protein
LIVGLKLAAVQTGVPQPSIQLTHQYGIGYVLGSVGDLGCFEPSHVDQGFCLGRKTSHTCTPTEEWVRVV